MFVTKVYSRDACNKEKKFTELYPRKKRTQKQCLTEANGIVILPTEKKRSLAPKMKRKCYGICV